MKKKTRTSASSGELHRSLDRMSRELVRLVNEHAKVAVRLAKLRQENGQRIYDAEGEQNLIALAIEHNKGPLDNRCVRTILQELLSGARSLVKPLRVAYLGPIYSYSHLAAIERFGSSAELIAVATIRAVFEELNRGHVDFGIVPIENSTDGRIVDTLGMFTRIPMRICGEVQLRIHHCLMAKCERSDVTEVYSKPQALSQCRDWLAKHMPLARAVEITSTAAAAQLAADKHGAAAIASSQAAARYGLNVIAENIEDNKNNLTRFSVIGNYDSPRTGQDKTAVMFEIPHKPGSLADAMTVFKRNRLNLTWIESFPLPGSQNEYLFFVEMEGHQLDAKIKRAVDSLQRRSLRFEVLGSYARSEPVG